MSADGKDPASGRGEISPEDREAFRKRAADIGRRLDTVTERRAPAGPQNGHSSAHGMAFRMMGELIAGVVVGLGLGWALDNALGTRPWLLVTFLMLGFAAGFWSIVRTAQREQARTPIGKPMLAGDDEDEK